TFHLVCFAWIFFRADSFSTAGSYLVGFGRWSEPSQYVTPFAVGLILLAMFFQFTPRNLGRWLAQLIQWLPSPVLGLLLGGGIWLIWTIAPEGVAPFIYFQF
ncbi:MAG: MBOAT family protein, partial [Parvibaculum sp.]|nr:MBOAT family protein [Parvibaculum sp.]